MEESKCKIAVLRDKLLVPGELLIRSEGIGGMQWTRLEKKLQ